ncbi:uncharacterized protein LOC127423557 [Myxocyprinus asiaticus]|uniref:uncharacterized protein LOC127423557 n=1 Tax=Myxocyprinus asiaticus TaxID=70543 RepID=UPI002223D268|nr:uncharacterized protein LOC127423557 [Myxocyprinus asiaticus]
MSLISELLQSVYCLQWRSDLLPVTRRRVGPGRECARLVPNRANQPRRGIRPSWMRQLGRERATRSCHVCIKHYFDGSSGSRLLLAHFKPCYIGAEAREGGGMRCRGVLTTAVRPKEQPRPSAGERRSRCWPSGAIEPLPGVEGLATGRQNAEGHSIHQGSEDSLWSAWVGAAVVRQRVEEWSKTRSRKAGKAGFPGLRQRWEECDEEGRAGPQLG